MYVLNMESKEYENATPYGSARRINKQEVFEWTIGLLQQIPFPLADGFQHGDHEGNSRERSEESQECIQCNGPRQGAKRIAVVLAQYDNNC